MTAICSNALLQALSLILIARNLGPSEYAVIVAATACAAIAAEFVGLGTGDLLIRDVSRDSNAHARAFGQALRLIGLTILPFCLVATLIAEQWFGPSQSMLVILTLVASEIVAIRFAWLGEQIAIAHHAIHTATVSRIFASSVRFAAVVVAVWMGTRTAQEWALYSVISSAILAAGCLAISIRRFGVPSFVRAAGASRDGLFFSLMQIIRAAQSSLDKFAVGSVATAATLGSFGAGSRVAQLGTMPAAAVLRMTYPTFFSEGSAGIRAATRLARRLAPSVLGLGVLSAAGVVGVAYLLPYFLGPEFGDAKAYVIMLSPLPVAYALQTLGGNILSGANFQAHRTIAMAAGLILTLVASFLGAQLAEVSGAIMGYVTGNFLFAASTWIAVWRLLQPADREPMECE
jgi:O-antigen/teichoic acid export membrane protein